MKNFKIFPFKLQSSEVVCRRYILHPDFILDAVEFFQFHYDLVNSNISQGINYLYFREHKYPIDFFTFLSHYGLLLILRNTCYLRVECSDFCFTCKGVSNDKIVINMYMTSDYAKSF